MVKTSPYTFQCIMTIFFLNNRILHVYQCTLLGNINDWCSVDEKYAAPALIRYPTLFAIRFDTQLSYCDNIHLGDGQVQTD